MFNDLTTMRGFAVQSIFCFMITKNASGKRVIHNIKTCERGIWKGT